MFCSNCRTYTLNSICTKCKLKALSPKPAKWSPEDRFGRYRRLAKKSSESQSKSI